MKTKNVGVVYFLIISIGLFLAGCQKTTPFSEVISAALSQSTTLTVLATSDLKDSEALAKKIETATGVKVAFKFGGTIESTERVLSGKATEDTAWFANAKYLLSDPVGASRVKLQEKIMLTPLVIGVSESSAKSLGWDNPKAKVTWKNVAEAASSGKLSYAMSNPATSNQGFMSLMGVASATAEKSDALTAKDLDITSIRNFLKGYKIVGDNSTYLSERFIAEQGKDANAFINYENWLMALNNSGKLKEKLTLVYPHEGVATADYPFMLLNDTKRAAYQKVVEYLKGDEAQEWISRTTLRRPINQGVAQKVAGLFPAGQLLVELPFSTDKVLADELVQAYLNEFRRPIASTFVLDTSGSMEGGRRTELINAIGFIAGGDDSLSGRLARLTARERVWLLPFSEKVAPVAFFEVPASSSKLSSAKKVDTLASSEEDVRVKKEAFSKVRRYASGLHMNGGTALYDAVFVALGAMNDEKIKFPEYAYSVVAFTDGENNEGRNFAAFKAEYDRLPASSKKIPVFMVLFGEANERELESLVKTTGGKVFDARKTPLSTVFKEIRAYQ